MRIVFAVQEQHWDIPFTSNYLNTNNFLSAFHRTLAWMGGLQDGTFSKPFYQNKSFCSTTL